MLGCDPITHESLLSGNLNKTEGVQALGVGVRVGGGWGWGTKNEHGSDMKSELSISSTDNGTFFLLV